jgi:hypothetical protein
MLFMVVEHFGVSLEPVAERFRQRGRVLPEGVAYVASWMEAGGSRCYQLMDAPDRAALDAWIACWSDLVAFDVAEVLASAEFWEKRPHSG